MAPLFFLLFAGVPIMSVALGLALLGLNRRALKKSAGDQLTLPFGHHTAASGE